MGYDGVYRSNIPHPDSLHKHMMTVSSRVDFAVSCTKDAHVRFHQGEENVDDPVSDMVTINVVSSSSSSSSVQNNDDPTNVILTSPALPSSTYWDIMDESDDD